MSKQQSNVILAAFGEVQKNAEKNKKARERKQVQETAQVQIKRKNVPAKVPVEDTDDDVAYEIETKSKRVNFLLYPSVYEKAKRHAKKNMQSLNDYVNTVLANDVYV